jgi:hypothetical protein
MLRQKLHEITENGDPSSHQKLIDDLRKQYAHTIAALVLDTQYGFNCVMHALGIIDYPRYVRLVLACPLDVYAGSAFVQYLIDGGQLKEQEAPASGRLMVYFDNGAVKHIGRLLSESRLESKWGVGHP